MSNATHKKEMRWWELAYLRIFYELFPNKARILSKCVGAESNTQVNGSVGRTKTRQSWKSGYETPDETAILNRFDSVPSFRRL